MISSSQQEISEDLLKLETSNPTSVAGTGNELDLCEKIFTAVSVEPREIKRGEYNILLVFIFIFF
jgi:hypothetical protein